MCRRSSPSRAPTGSRATRISTFCSKPSPISWSDMPLTAIALAAALQASTPPMPAAPQSDNDRLRACLALIRSAPQQAASEAQAWVAAGEPQRALQALDAALTTAGLAPAQRAQVLLDRARAQVALGRTPQARADIDS